MASTLICMLMYVVDIQIYTTKGELRGFGVKIC